MRIEFSPMGINQDSYEAALASTKRAENLGFDFTNIPENFCIGHRTWTDPMVTIGAVAHATHKIEFLTSLIGVNRHHPVMLAFTAATVDQFAKGRLRLGLGLGGPPEDAISGISHAHSISKLRETVEIMRKLWTEKDVHYTGRIYQLKGVTLDIRPYRNPIPIWIAAQSPLSQKVAGELADVWMSNWLHSPKLFKEKFNVVRNHAKKAGRNPNEIRGMLEAWAHINKDQSVAEEKGIPIARRIPFRLSQADYGRRQLGELGLKTRPKVPEDIPAKVIMKCSIIGDPEYVTKRIEEYIRNGVQYFFLSMNPDGVDLFAREVLPHFREP